MKKYNKIVSQFEKTATKLEALEKENLSKEQDLDVNIATLQNKIDNLHDKQRDLRAEAAAAMVTALKLRDFLGE